MVMTAAQALLPSVVMNLSPDQQGRDPLTFCVCVCVCCCSDGEPAADRSGGLG